MKSSYFYGRANIIINTYGTNLYLVRALSFYDLSRVHTPLEAWCCIRFSFALNTD